MKLNQIIAVLKGVKSRVYGEVTSLHKEAQKTEPFNGFIKTYKKKDDEGEDFPQDRKKVLLNATDVLARLASLQTEAFDAEAILDWGNCTAKSDVEVDGRVLIKGAPVTYLLFLEKQLNDIRTFIEKMPVLDEAEEWVADPNSSLYRSNTVQTHRTKKVPKVLVKYEATDKHPAQTEVYTEDVVVGYWDTVRHSGALPLPRKRVLMERTDKLIKAVKSAREQGNDAECEKREVGAAIFGYLLE